MGATWRGQRGAGGRGSSLPGEGALQLKLPLPGLMRQWEHCNRPEHRTETAQSPRQDNSACKRRRAALPERPRRAHLQSRAGEWSGLSRTQAGACCLEKSSGMLKKKERDGVGDRLGGALQQGCSDDARGGGIAWPQGGASLYGPFTHHRRYRCGGGGGGWCGVVYASLLEYCIDLLESSAPCRSNRAC